MNNGEYRHIKSDITVAPYIQKKSEYIIINVINSILKYIILFFFLFLLKTNLKKNTLMHLPTI